jgi:hypothetical protein
MLLDRIDEQALVRSDVIPWSSPVPSFGDPSRARVATLGLNPSNREFVDTEGRELDGKIRRFPTLNSLGLRSWSTARREHVELIVDACQAYFLRNPYDGWFRKLDFVIASTQASYYDERNRACHLDLIPFATTRKWTELKREQRSSLLRFAGDTLARVLRDTPVRVMVLNGASVVRQFEELAEVRLHRRRHENWTLPRRDEKGVCGVSYSGTVRTIAGAALSREILVLGFNHNLQSSFGVTSNVARAIRGWIGRASQEALR